MKIKLAVNENQYVKLKTILTEKGIEIDENAEFILTQRNSYLTTLMGKQKKDFYKISVQDIICIESFSHDIIVHTINGDYKINERLRQLETLLNPNDFLRISNSVIISCDKIKKIKPTLSSKFILTMCDGKVVDVTRSYYYIFREVFGI